MYDNNNTYRPEPMVRHDVIAAWLQDHADMCQTIVTHEWGGALDTVDHRVPLFDPKHPIMRRRTL